MAIRKLLFFGLPHVLVVALTVGACSSRGGDDNSAPKTATLSQAVDSIGASCDPPRRQTIPGTDVASAANPWTLQDCYWESGHFYLEFPDDWNQTYEIRLELCQAGTVILDQVVATDGGTWMATAESNAATEQLADALSNAGLEVLVMTYCPPLEGE